MQPDPGTQWVNVSLLNELKNISIVYIVAQGYPPQPDGAAERFIRLMKTIRRRMLVPAPLDTNCRLWAVENATEAVRAKALKPNAKVTLFGESFIVSFFPFRKKVWEQMAQVEGC